MEAQQGDSRKDAKIKHEDGRCEGAGASGEWPRSSWRSDEVAVGEDLERELREIAQAPLPVEPLRLGVW